MSNTSNDEWKKREIGAFWSKTSASGKTFYSGTVNVTENGAIVKKRVVMFANKDKKNPSAPDFSVYLSDENGSNGSAGSAGSSGSTGPQRPPNPGTSGPSSGPASTGPRSKAKVAPKPTEDIPYGME